MYIYYNANPVRKSHGDCVIRALSKVLDIIIDKMESLFVQIEDQAYDDSGNLIIIQTA